MNWFAVYAAERHGAQVVGFTVAEDQVKWAHAHHADLAVDIRHDDYRNATGRYDAVVSIGLMEHVGPKNCRGCMELVDRCLVPGGVAFVHPIAGNRARSEIDPWFGKYIFPNAVLPTLGPSLRAHYGDPFYRMWRFDLHTSAASFRTRRQQVYQLVLTRPGTPSPPGRRAWR